ncbi:MAG: hypothetical protein AAF744_13995 [Pseudomonadota bacterium]
MNGMRELMLILSTFTWIGAGIWVATHIIGADMTQDQAQAEAMQPRLSYFVFALGIAVYFLTSVFWKKRPET